MNELAIYDGRQIPTPEINGKRYVAMKPLVEGMGLNWDNQLGLIKNDEVLKSTIAVTAIVAEDGKLREMTCLPEEYLQGWLFKIPASRYKGERKEKLLKYQRECYRALHDYWTKGGAVNPRAADSQIKTLIDTIRDDAEERAGLILENKSLRTALAIAEPMPGSYGLISRATLKARIEFRRAYWRSDRRKHRNDTAIQLKFLLAPTTPDSKDKVA
jgi:hypothetical protein